MTRVRRGGRAASIGTALACVVALAGCRGTEAAGPTTSPTSGPAQRPSATATPKGPVPTLGWRDLAYAGVPDQGRLLDVFRPKAVPKAPVVIMVHGGAWAVGDRTFIGGSGARPTAARTRDLLLRRGYAVASVGYRLSKTARYPAPVDDVKAAVRYLREHATELGLDPTRMALFGESAGGHLAELAALTAAPAERVTAVVAYYAPSDLTAMTVDRVAQGCPPGSTWPESRLLGVDPSTPRGAALGREASPVSHITAGAPPMLLVHGSRDCLVATVQSQRMAAALTKARVPADLLTIDAGHADQIFWTSPVVHQRLVAFLRTQLG